MMNFYCLYAKLYEGVQQRIDQLKEACLKYGINFIALNSFEADYSNLPTLGKTDLLYNCAIGSQTLESLLLNNNVTTFYLKKTSSNLITSSTDFTLLHTKANLPQPKTIFGITTNRELLKKYVNYVGGFPLILKATGSTRGIGTIKIETWQNLISTVDYLVNTNAGFIIREFIKAKSGCRMIVLGNVVIAGADFAMNEGDFRNAVDLTQVHYYKREYPESVKKIAVEATHLCNTEFSGVDFLEDEQGNFYLLEVNFPTGFSGLINVCNVDIPFKMIEHLKNKVT